MLEDGLWEADGGTPVHELNADARLKLPESSDYVTVAGLILERLGNIPRGGETVDVPPYRLTVLRVDGHRVARVRIQAEPPV
jgi:putative hemolysin